MLNGAPERLLLRTLILYSLCSLFATAQDSSRRAGLETLFATDGPVLEDANGDGWTDSIKASFWLGETPDPALIAAASEIAIRLGFETMAVDLPLKRGNESTDGADRSAMQWVFGEQAIQEYNQTHPGVLASLPDRALAESQSAVDWIDDGERVVVVFRGHDAASIHHAATTLAGRWPALWAPGEVEIHTLIERVTSSVTEHAGDGAVSHIDPRVMSFTTSTTEAGLARLELSVIVTPSEPGDGAILETIAGRLSEADPTTLGFAGLRNLVLDFRLPSNDDAVARRVELAGSAPSPEDGPIAARPGATAKRNLDLSSLYTPDGLLGDADGNQIPDRIDAMISLGDTSSVRAIDLSARLGLESTGVQLPAVSVADADDIDSASERPTLILLGEQPLTAELHEQEKILSDTLEPQMGRIEILPEAFGDKPAVVVSGGDQPGLDRAVSHLAEKLPHLDELGSDRPTIDDVEMGLWKFLTARSPMGQAAAAVYKLDRLVDDVPSDSNESVHVLISLEKPDARLKPWIEERIHSRLGRDRPIEVRVDDRDVQNAGTIFEEQIPIASEVSEFLRLFESRVLPEVNRRQNVRIRARLSEPIEIRRALESHIRQALQDKRLPSDRIDVQVLSAYKQGYSWITEHVAPAVAGRELSEIVIRFAKNTPPEEWPQQAMQTPLRWLHEIFPVDEILSRELGIDIDRVRLEMASEDEPTYQLAVVGNDGVTLFEDSFEPMHVLRPYIDRFRDYEMVKVTTGWFEATLGDDVVLNQRIATDPERFWDHFQQDTLNRMYDYVMERHEGNPRGGGKDAPLFGELVVDLELSEPHRLLNLDNELISSIDALHEDIYFTGAMFYRVLGRLARGEELTYPGRILPRVRASGATTIEQASEPGLVKIRFTGFQTSRPAVVVRVGDSQAQRLDIPKVEVARPSALAAWVSVGNTGIDQLDLRVKVDTEDDERDALVGRVTPLNADERILSAAQVTSMLRHVESMKAEGLYADALAYRGLGRIRVFAGWEHEVTLASEPNALLSASRHPPSLPEIHRFREYYRQPGTEHLVQWEEPIPPREAYGILARMSDSDEATVYKLGESYLGEDVWAMDLMPPIRASHWSRYKATTLKPTIIYSARQHANEVSSTSHVLRFAEELLQARREGGDHALAKALDKINVVVHPITNPDGAQLAYDLYRETPDLILHAGYWASLGMDVTSDANQPMPIYPEAALRPKIWKMWLPDIFLNPHGYPSHQLVQLFSEYTGLVRRGRNTERNWSMNKGWFIPGFSYFDDPRFPRHKQAAFEIRDYITNAITSVDEVHAMNQRNYDRYDRYGGKFDEEVFRLEMTDEVLIHTAIKGARAPGPGNQRGYDPKVTIWSGSTEAPDETAHGEWLELVASAGLAWDHAILKYLLEGEHRVDRKHESFYGGTHLSLHRDRPPKPKDDAQEQ